MVVSSTKTTSKRKCTNIAQVVVLRHSKTLKTLIGSQPSPRLSLSHKTSLRIEFTRNHQQSFPNIINYFCQYKLVFPPQRNSMFLYSCPSNIRVSLRSDGQILAMVAADGCLSSPLVALHEPGDLRKGRNKYPMPSLRNLKWSYRRRKPATRP